MISYAALRKLWPIDEKQNVLYLRLHIDWKGISIGPDFRKRHTKQMVKEGKFLMRRYLNGGLRQGT